MLITVLKSKISYATITQTELYYEGSIAIDQDWIEAAGLNPYEYVQIVNLNNGERFETYVISGAPGSKVIGLNGPAARCGEVGDQVHILSYGQIAKDTVIPKPSIICLKEMS